MAISIIAPPTVEPVTVDELKLHCRINGTAEDTLLPIYIAAARAKAEGELGRALVHQTWRQRLDQFGSRDAQGCVTSEIRLEKPQVRSVTSVTYIDPNGDEQTLAADRYALDSSTLPGWLLPADGMDWPETADVINAVSIDFVAGFGADASSVPADVRAWILLTAAFLYANREAMDASGRITALPNRWLDGLLDPWRVFGV
jgi:uncharacterized phiE125 gp8 family phage protein